MKKPQVCLRILPPPSDGMATPGEKMTGLVCCLSACGVSQAILKAMKVPMEFALGTLRLSVGRHSTPAEIDTAADLIVAEAKKQKQQ
jgi:cysteine sulfinate desulfinase/cysteine desulfurase-like protein